MGSFEWVGGTTIGVFVMSATNSIRRRPIFGRPWEHLFAIGLSVAAFTWLSKKELEMRNEYSAILQRKRLRDAAMVLFMNPSYLCGGEPWGPWKSGMLTECFQQVTIMNVLGLFLLISAVVRIKELFGQAHFKNLKLGRVQGMEMSLSLGVMMINLGSLSAQFVVDKWVWFQLFSDVRDIFIWGVSVMMVTVEWAAGARHAWTVRAWWVLQFVSLSLVLQALMSTDYFYSYGYGFDVVVTLGKLVCVTVLSILGLWFPSTTPQAFIPLTPQHHHDGKSYGSLSQEESKLPYSDAGIFSKLFFLWPTSLMRLGYKRTLVVTDLWSLSKEDECKYNFKLFNKNWQHQKKKQKPSLFKALSSTYGVLFWVSGIGKLLQDGGAVVGPLILSKIVHFIQEPNAPFIDGFYWVIVQSIGSNLYLFTCTRIGNQVRAALIASIYDKSLRIDSSSQEKFTSGEVLNLQAIDPIRLSVVVPLLHQLWSSALLILASFYLLWTFLGPSMIAGIVVLVAVLPTNIVVTRKMTTFQLKLMEFRDQRIKTITEILAGIRLVKFFNWESNFKEKINSARHQEVKQLRNAAVLRAVWIFAYWGSIQWVAGASFVAYVLSGHLLTAEVAFGSLAIFNTLRGPLGVLPNTLSSAVEALVSLRRVERYLLTSDVDPSVAQPLTKLDEQDNVAILVKNGNFKWTENSSSIVLKNININIKKGQLVAIVGPVGCGKSAFASMLLGELYKETGEIFMDTDIAYVPQQAWMQNATLRDNILFGLPYNEELYQSCLHACELVQDILKLVDIQALPGGDQTEIGEKGINISGGQKQRISLARAMYHNSELYVLDSPLSAVDGHVGALHAKTRILITHQLDILNRVDSIIVLNEGSIQQVGTYQELIESGLEFSDLIAKHVGTLSTGVQKKEYAPKTPKSNLVKSLEGSEKLVTQEEKQQGTLSWRVYKKYLKGAGVGFMIFVIFLCAIETFGRTSADWWISSWTSKATTMQDNKHNLVIYLVWISVNALITLTRGWCFLHACIRAAVQLHDNMLARVLRAPIQFFDTTPLGRILNRFSKDLTSIDENLPALVSALFSCGFALLSIVVVITMVTPVFLIPLLPISYLYYYVQQYYLSSSREIQRFDAISKSPIYALFTETLQGISTIRAYRLQDHFIKMNENLVNSNSKALFAFNAAARWFGIRLEIMCSIVVSLAALFCIVEKETINPGLAGLSLSYVLILTNMLNIVNRSFVDVETYLVSVERVCEYSSLPVEAPHHLAHVSSHWPEKGAIRFDKFKMRYRHNLNFALKGISFTINPQEKIGILGRTGSGKSSIFLCIFRLVEATEGAIYIDNIDISKIGLADLRSRLAIIPQDPILFAGTIRSNLDPFEQYSDTEVWRALDQVDMKSSIENIAEKLDSCVTEGGSNFSVGQRQLLCLGRALLHNSKILCIDEATAAIDLETDLKIQRTIREQFRNSTVLTIAHRVLVMDQGQVAEFDSIQNLKENSSSIFYSLLQETVAN